jgi:hypothetical protein
MPAPPDPDSDGEEGNNKTDKKDEHVSERGLCGNYTRVVLLGFVCD